MHGALLHTLHMTISLTDNMTTHILTDIEAFAQYVRGATTLFVVFWCFILFRYKRRNRMMKLLYVSTVWLAFSYLKDAVFIFSAWKSSMFINNVAVTIDLVSIPLISCFFIESVRPGYVSDRLVKLLAAGQGLFMPLYLVTRADAVLHTAHVLSLAMAIYTVWMVISCTLRYHKYILTNYSYTQNIDVVWVATSCVIFFLAQIIFTLSFYKTTWLSESLYNVFSIVAWSVIYTLARRHKVLKMVRNTEYIRFDPLNRKRKIVGHNDNGANNNAKGYGNDGDNENIGDNVNIGDNENMYMNENMIGNEYADDIASEEKEDNGADTRKDKKTQEEVTYHSALISKRLKKAMEEDKMYKDPKLSLFDVSIAIGTNRTYISDYINKTLGLTFKDYINNFRVEEAMRIIESMTIKERISMAEVARLSGFNSTSTFNRNFQRVTGKTPKDYFINNKQ